MLEKVIVTNDLLKLKHSLAALERRDQHPIIHSAPQHDSPHKLPLKVIKQQT